ncbi:unnamed protein product [Thelazia callipaeda]|uniref:T-complex protein 1 subunit gamma n=1 Tax=Thelazia callipaeda TaxID=103827 RepID=A0A158RBY0_THECL|nr:unnamed protein product [Thelazia callipaeda]
MMRESEAAPVIILNKSTTRESGNKVQFGNIAAAKTIADVIRTSLGPRAMLKMLLDPMGGIVITNDGNAILREITVKHPAAKTLIEIARTQDEETGDGTTSVIVMTGEVMSQARQFLDQNIHPTSIIQVGYRMALEDMIVLAKKKFSKVIDINNDEEMGSVVKSCLGTKMLSKWIDLAIKIALNAVRTIRVTEHGHEEIDIKRYCRIEKIPGGRIEDSQVIRGVVLNKDVTHAKMSRCKEKPRIVLLDCNIEYKKGESQMSLEIMKKEDFSKILEQEEEAIRRMCNDIIAVKPDIVFTEKGISDLAQHYLLQAGITAIRRLKKSDNNRLARVSGATIVNDTQNLREEDVGKNCDLFEITKIGDEYYTYVTSKKATADVMNELERNLQDALNVVRNVMLDPRLVPGGGALEMALAHALNEEGKSIGGVRQWPYKAVAHALEVIPRTLVQNCGGSTIRQLTALRAKHAQSASNWTWGIDGYTGQLVDMNITNIWDPLIVRLQVLKTSIETSVMLLRIDDIVSGMKKREETGHGDNNDS